MIMTVELTVLKIEVKGQKGPVTMKNTNWLKCS